jgi:hypothetical protein
MATQRFKCIKECFCYNKRFKKGAEFPMAWLDNGYTPPPAWFVPEQDYADVIRKNQFPEKITSAGSDPRPTAVLIDALHKYMGDVPKTWKRSQIWGALIARESAEARSETNKKGPGRPAKE